jgi:hypothetical protein
LGNSKEVVVELARIFDGKKFMWDGRTFQYRGEVEEVLHKYQSDGFEVEVIEEEGCNFLFNRRVVPEVVVEAGPS